MGELEEARSVMRELISRLGNQKRAAKRLGRKPTALNYSLHYAKSIPMKHVMKMKLVLNELEAKEVDKVSATVLKTPLTDSVGLQFALLKKEKPIIEAHFKAMKAVLLPSYASNSDMELLVKLVNVALYHNVDLVKAEKTYRLPLRTAFLGLLACSDQNGDFYWDLFSLKDLVFPYLQIDLTPILEALCHCGLIEKKSYRGITYGHIPHRNHFVYEIQNKPDLKKPKN